MEMENVDVHIFSQNDWSSPFFTWEDSPDNWSNGKVYARATASEPIHLVVIPNHPYNSFSFSYKSIRNDGLGAGGILGIVFGSLAAVFLCCCC